MTITPLSQEMANALSSYKASRTDKYSLYRQVITGIANSIYDTNQKIDRAINEISDKIRVAYGHDLLYVYSPDTALSSSPFEGNVYEFLSLEPKDADDLELIEANFTFEELNINEITAQNINIENVINNQSIFISINTNAILIDQNGTPLTLTIYGIDKFGRNTKETIEMPIPGYMQTKTMWSYLHEVKNNSNIDLTTLDLHISTYPIINSIINDTTLVEYDSNKNKLYTQWELDNNNKNILIKNQYTPIGLINYYTGKIEELDSIVYRLPEEMSLIFPSKDYPYIYAINSDHNKFYIFSKHEKINNNPSKINVDNSTFCPIKINVQPAFESEINSDIRFIDEINLDFKSNSRSNRIEQYRIRIYHNDTWYYFNTNSLTNTNTTMEELTSDNLGWFLNEFNDAYGSGFPIYQIISDKYSIVVDIKDDRGIVSHAIYHSINRNFEVLNEFNILNIDTIGTDPHGFLYMHDFSANKTYYVKFIYNKYYNDAELNLKYMLNNDGNNVPIEITNILLPIDDYSTINGVERDPGESMYDFMPYAEQSFIRNIGTDKISAIYGLASNLRLKIKPSIIVNNEYSKISILNNVLYRNNTSYDLTSMTIDEVTDYTGNEVLVKNNNEYGKYLMPFTNFRIEEQLTKVGVTIDIPVKEDERLYSAYISNTNLSLNINKTLNTITIEDDPNFKDTYVNITYVIIKKYYAINYSDIYIDSIKNMEISINDEKTVRLS